MHSWLKLLFYHIFPLLVGYKTLCLRTQVGHEYKLNTSNDAVGRYIIVCWTTQIDVKKLVILFQNPVRILFFYLWDVWNENSFIFY